MFISSLHQEGKKHGRSTLRCVQEDHKLTFHFWQSLSFHGQNGHFNPAITLEITPAVRRFSRARHSKRLAPSTKVDGSKFDRKNPEDRGIHASF